MIVGRDAPRPAATEILLATGRPKFLDATAQALASSAGITAAWGHVLASGDPAALAQVHGDFGVAWRDIQGRTGMAVDRFAVCSLCYRSDGDTLQVAERADALAGGGSTELSPQALFDYLYFHAIPSPRTIFAGVSRVPPAHCVLWQNGQLTVQRYWNPDFDAPVQQTSFGALRGEFRDLLKAGVSDQMDPQRPACFLSGGTDSSTVAGMLRQVSAGPVSSYSIGFDAEGYDEMAYARLASKHFDTEHHEYYVTPQDLVASIPSVAASYDQPFGNSSAVPAFYCARMAKLDGVQRILAGDGGDELFAGNVRYAKQRVFDLYGHVPAALRSALIEPLAAWPAGQGFPPLRKLASYVQQARQPMPGRMEGYNLLLRLGMSNVLAPEFLARVDAADPVHQQTGVWAQTQSSSSLNRQLAFDWRYTLAENDLPKVCGTAQLAGLTVGFPMLDARLVDFSLRLPTSYKLRVLRLRWFFKEALRGFLPDDIISKKKHGFGLPFGVWMTRNPALNTLAVDSLRSLGSRNIVRPAFIQDLLDNKLGSHPGYYGEMVWILMMLEQWLRVHSPDYRVA